MNKRELMFYNEYEEFYKMAEKSHAFYAFCKAAFGNDFSQDGFSDINQINMILPYIPLRDNVHILDIGCGNGKMLGYLRKKRKVLFTDLIIRIMQFKQPKNYFLKILNLGLA